MNIADFIHHSEPELINNIALMLEKSMNDKIVLSEDDKEELMEIMETVKILEEQISSFSHLTDN